jgi:hypothetical protein
VHFQTFKLWPVSPIVSQACLIEPKVSTVNFLFWLLSLVCGNGACAMFSHTLLEEIACLTFGFPRHSRYSKDNACSDTSMGKRKLF